MHQTVLLLIIANVLFSYKGLKDASFFEKYKFQIGPISNGEKIRLVSSGFLHADYMHLGFNMYALYLFSTNVIAGVGVSNFVLLYFGSLIFGSLFTMTYHKKEPYYSAVGASGAVSGIVYSAVLLFPNMTLILFPIPIPLPGYVFGIGYLLYSIYGMKKQIGNVGHTAHLGGAIAGFALTLLVKPQIFIQHTWVVLGMAIPVVLLLLFEKKLKQ
jgi:membrane associated rhomboid family serine protease